MKQPTTRRKPKAPPTDLRTLPFADNFEYLAAELDWLEQRLRQRAHAIPPHEEFSGSRARGRHARGRIASEEDELSVAQRERRANAAEALADTLRAILDARLEVHRAAVARGEATELGLDRLCRRFDLDPVERLTLLLTYGATARQGLVRILAAIDDTIGRNPTVGAILQVATTDLREAHRLRRLFFADGTLSREGLLRIAVYGSATTASDLPEADIEMPLRTYAWVCGEDELDGDISEVSALLQPVAHLDDVVLPDIDRRRLRDVVLGHDRWLADRAAWGLDEVVRYGKGALVLLHGPPGTGKTMTAHGLAAALGKRVLSVDLLRLGRERDLSDLIGGVFREARLHDAMLFFDECEVLLGSRNDGNLLMTLLLGQIERFDGVAVFATNAPATLDEAMGRRFLVQVAFTAPDVEERAAIWRHHLPPGLPYAPDFDHEAACASLSERFELTGGLIKNAVLTAAAQVSLRMAESGGPGICLATLEAAALGQLRRPIDESTRLQTATLDALVVDAGTREILDDVVSAARHIRGLGRRQGVGAEVARRRGVTLLLNGAPGTGKTLAARALAGELGRPLRVVLSSTVLSRYVGEAERNLEEHFKAAAGEGAVLFFDECEALLRSRNEALASRHDVSLVGTLLGLLDRHSGVVVFATNHAELVDAAFLRRMLFVATLHAPDQRLRRQLWERALAGVPGLRAEAAAGRLMAWPLTGAQISDAVLRAALRAESQGRTLTVADLELAVTDCAAMGQPNGQLGGVGEA